jgi:hypothetical protein
MGALLTTVVACVLATACEIPDYRFVEEDSGSTGEVPPPGLATPKLCQTDPDCAELAATKLCDPMHGYCVECVPGGAATCSDGLFCVEPGRCTVGCAAHEACHDGLACNAESHRCTGCSTDADCLLGTICESAVCVPSCVSDAGCPSGFSCCAGECKSPLSDPSQCGGCGKACVGAQSCINGHCGTGPCPQGFAECNANPDDGCETDVRSDPLNCGKCRLACASGFCSGGTCTSVDCPTGLADCNQQEADRCETNLAGIENCGRCGKACSSLNGDAACTGAGCAISCSAGFGDCDEDVDTGCETDLTTTVLHCGQCGAACENEHGSVRCTEGSCAPRCGQGFDDCDGDPNNGCETDLTTSLSDCGGCGVSCEPAHATGVCEEGACTPTCEDGFADCNGDAADGCEADLSAPETCGACDNVCSAKGGKATCDASGKCGIDCGAGHADCINGLEDGCETDTNASAVHCGTCDTLCPTTVGTAACYDGTCGVSSCILPNAECDGKSATLCETNVNTDPLNCGACSNECYYPNAGGKCVAGSCVQDACNAGFVDCTTAPGCETPLGTVTNCRRCGESCSNAHGGAACSASGCVPSCAIGWGDCDGNLNNGCETQLDTLANCGACGAACSKAHASASCSMGSCQIVMCEAGFGNCDDEATRKNGCESPLNTLVNCGGCGVACDLPHAGESCGSGSCRLTACDASYADCTTALGCETTLGTVNNCKGCGDSCVNNHGATACGASGCTPTCDAGWKSCDGALGNGCETSVRANSNCGDCGVTCDLPNASESCSTGTCVVQGCTGNFADCTSAAGCETALGTVSNCKSCGNACSNAHGTTSCSASGCVPSCSAGWESCDPSQENGCETSIWSVSNCGACGQLCDIPNSSESCGGGVCSATNCSAGFADCTAATGCETQLGTVANCTACGEACSNAHGTTSCTASGCSPTCDAGFKDCDTIPDNGCETNIHTLTACGACGVSCSFPNASASCATGTCTQTSCTAGFADCSAAAGCETQLGTATNCASCGNACTNAHGTNACGGSPGSYDCAPICDPGFKDCDGNPDNGCEASLTSLTSCGACNAVCDLPNASESCATGSCALVGCAAGFVDCTSAPGCETPLGTSSNCSGCGDTCTNAHGTAACTGSAGTYDCAPGCSAGWKSCDGDPDNGCEQSVTSLTNCGDCGVPCAFSNAAASCGTGTCTMGACSAGYGDCTSATGCETLLGTTTNCASCGNACTNTHGSNGCTGAPGSYDCAPSCDAGFGSCDGDPDNGCETDVTTTSNCGVCGRACGASTPFCVAGACVNFLQIQLVNASANGFNTASTPLDIAHTLQTAPSSYRLVVALVASDANGQAQAKPASVSYVTGATSAAFTLAKEVWSGNRVWSGIYFIRDASLPAAGSYTVRITGSGSEFAKVANVYELKGVDQVNPIDNAGAATGGGTAGNCSSSDPTGSVTTVTSNAFLLTTVGTFGTDAGTPSSGQVQTLTRSAGSIGFKAGYKAMTPIGGTTIIWDMTNCNQSSNALVALKPASAP